MKRLFGINETYLFSIFKITVFLFIDLYLVDSRMVEWINLFLLKETVPPFTSAWWIPH